MTERPIKKTVTGIVLLVLSLVCALVFYILVGSYPAEIGSDPEALPSFFGVDLNDYVSFSGVDLYAFAKTVVIFFAVLVLCLLGTFFGVMSSLSGIPTPLRLGGVCAACLNLGFALVHIFRHGEFLFAMLEAL